MVKKRSVMKKVALSLSIMLVAGVMCVLFIHHATVKRNSIPQTDTSGFTCYKTSSENICNDSETGIGFVNNELLVIINSNSSEKELKQVLEEIDGKIVGKFDKINYYQVQLGSVYGYEELQNIADTLTENSIIADARVNYAFPASEASYIPNDKEWETSWKEKTAGNNWGVEAIDAASAWEYKDLMTDVNIGVMDTMFYTGHEDLTFDELPFGNSDAIKKHNEFNAHGTHVSGIIGANFDNKAGISGVAIKRHLYGVSLWRTAEKDVMATVNDTYCAAFYYLIAEKKCKVINISMGNDLLEFCASQEANSSFRPATNELNALADCISYFLSLLLKSENEFVICVCAGNKNDGAYQYFEKDKDDEQIPYMYYSYSDYEEYLNGERSHYDYTLYKDREDEIRKRLVRAENMPSNNIFTKIKNRDVRNRVLIVGAVQNEYDEKAQTHTGYSLASFSQCGDGVDIVAPGADIYSTVPEKGWFNRLKSGYQNLSGTSMATPFVSGVAGLILSVNPDLSGDRVKDILCETATGEFGVEKYKMVSAKNAVERATNKGTAAKEGDIKEKLLGEWELDEDKICRENQVNMWDLFGTGIKYGSSMTFAEDGTFSYYIGIGVGGEGTYSIRGSDITYHVAQYEDGSTETGRIVFDESDGQRYLLTYYFEYTLYWKPVTELSDNTDQDSQRQIMTEDSSVQELYDAIYGKWYTRDSLIGFYEFAANGNCKVLFDDVKPGIFEITDNKVLKITMPWLTEQLDWDSNSGETRKGWCFTSDDELIIEGIVYIRSR